MTSCCTRQLRTDAGMYLHAGPEIGVASTKAFTCQAIQILARGQPVVLLGSQQSCQVVALLLMALRLGKQRGVLSETMWWPRALDPATVFFTLPVSDREFATTNPLSMFHARLNSYCAALNSVPDSIERWPVAECGTCWDTLASRVKCLERLSALTDQTRVVSKPGSKKGSATSIQQQYGAILTTLTRAEVFSSSHKCDLQWNGHPLSSRSGRCLETEGPAWIVCITSLRSNLLHFPGCKRFERGSRGSQFWV